MASPFSVFVTKRCSPIYSCCWKVRPIPCTCTLQVNTEVPPHVRQRFTTSRAMHETWKNNNIYAPGSRLAAYMTGLMSWSHCWHEAPS